MIAIEQRKTNIRSVRVTWAIGSAQLLALLAAVSYVLIGLNVLSVGNLQPSEAPAAITYVCAVSYLLGGLLIMLHLRWLWLVGAVINALVMLVFFAAYIERPSVLFSPGGLATKAAELLLEVGLIYIIVISWRQSPRRGSPAV